MPSYPSRRPFLCGLGPPACHIPYKRKKGKLPFWIGQAVHFVEIFEIRKGISKSKASINQNFKQKDKKKFEMEKKCKKVKIKM